LGHTAITLNDRPTDRTATVALDQSLETKADGRRARCNDAFCHEPIDLTRNPILYPGNELCHANRIAICIA